MNHNQTVIAPFKFSGSKKDVSRISTFLLSFETQFVECGIEDEYAKICYVAQNFTDDALEWFANYFNLNDCRAMTYSAFAADFKDYHSSKIDPYQLLERSKRTSQKGDIDPSEIDSYQLMENWKQTSQKKDIDTYVKQFMTYHAMLPRGYTSDAFAIDLFIQGVRLQTRQMLRMYQFDRLIDAVNAAKKIEHCRKNSDVSLDDECNLTGNKNKLDTDLDCTMNRINNTRHGYSKTGRKYTGKDKEGKNSNRKDNFQEKFYNVCRRNKLCFNCGSPDHIKANCPGNARRSY
ncbi:uncharacterized protein SCDLUD_004132 [Saccharomycodes ludwigii]|uniref:uncharacterized protein n=1 Tax=Saccharomycodes ludwigii TaxID=36035 RepID=UPI001E82B5DB|nr:hypothetical protein SCDLUD_004132 [Saccharomycodes ludwigii]KAH3899837.1 hypothetical protein SCDLUD_004132 [Saccharomycodes ludwigii]